MSDMERIRSELWRVLEEAHDGTLDENQVESQVSILDALTRTFEAEAIQGDRRITPSFEKEKKS